ncbi:MAG: OmpH family outer membrane protein [Bryobacteraceae bacterium]
MRSFVFSCAAVCAAGLISLSPAKAQAPAGPSPSKVAVVNFQNAVLSTGEIQKALKDIQMKYKPRQDALQKGQQELSDIQTQLQASQGKLSQAGEADLTARGQRKQTQLQRMSDDLTADFDADRDDAVRKASTRMQELLKKVAEEKGLDLIVDTAAAPFFKPGIEITDQVVAAYDKAYPAK